MPYSFYVNEAEITRDLHSLLAALTDETNDEDVLRIVYQVRYHLPFISRNLIIL